MTNSSFSKDVISDFNFSFVWAKACSTLPALIFRSFSSCSFCATCSRIFNTASSTVSFFFLANSISDKWVWYSLLVFKSFRPRRLFWMCSSWRESSCSPSRRCFSKTAPASCTVLSCLLTSSTGPWAALISTRAFFFLSRIPKRRRSYFCSSIKNWSWGFNGTFDALTKHYLEEIYAKRHRYSFYLIPTI